MEMDYVFDIKAEQGLLEPLREEGSQWERDESKV